MAKTWGQRKQQKSTNVKNNFTSALLMNTFQLPKRLLHYNNLQFSVRIKCTLPFLTTNLTMIPYAETKLFSTMHC